MSPKIEILDNKFQQGKTEELPDHKDGGVKQQRELQFNFKFDFIKPKIIDILVHGL